MKARRPFFQLAIFPALALLAVPAVFAGTIPDATYSGSIEAAGVVNTFKTLTHTGSLSTAGMTLTFDAAPFPSIDAVAVVPGNENATVGGDLSYFFEFSGPAGPSIPVDFDVTMKLSFTMPHTIEHASISVFDPNGGPGSVSDCFDVNTGCPAPSGSKTETLSTSIVPNVVYEVDLEAILTLDAATAQSGEAYVDPYIHIDPSFSTPGDYTLNLSPGIGNAPTTSSAAPEPSTWCLMLLGALPVLKRLRRSK